MPLPLIVGAIAKKALIGAAANKLQSAFKKKKTKKKAVKKKPIRKTKKKK
jgi:predicted benzoate:H+ symporter BenE